jgi:hypothetical protein
MVWQLTLSCSLLVSRVVAVASEPSAPPTHAQDGSKANRATTHTVHWEQLPLGDAVKRLKAVSNVFVVVDRRVDPGERINLSVANASAGDIVAQLADAGALGHVSLQSLFYVGPPRTAERLSTLAALRRKDVAALANDQRRSLSERRGIVWPRLTEPRRLIVRLIENHGWRVERSERIPHDLWPAGELPKLALADQLTVLLAGFDRTYRLLPERQAIEIVPLDWDQVEPSSTTAAGPAHSRPEPPKSGGKQVFTLRVQDQPVGKILEELGRRLGWQLDVDEAAIRAAGRSLDRRVTFAVENASAEGLLEALLDPAGLRAERHGESVHVGPR